MLDPVSVCTFALKNNPGSYALFIGSGVSLSSKIPTGWDVIIDLISQIAILEDQKTDDPYIWYKNKFNKEPNYSDLLSQVAKTQLSRQNLLQKYFEPTDDDIQQGIKTPTRAHKSISKLVKKGFIKIIITTNFDRLMEKALHDVNVDPLVVKSSDDVSSAPPLAHLKNPLIIKLNGDYLDLRFKNTIEELSNYDSQLCFLLKNIFSNYGLIVSGWSAKWDLEIVNMLKSTNSVFETFWSEPYNLSSNAKEIIEQKRGLLIQKSSDDFFPLLDEQLTKLIPEQNLTKNNNFKEDSFPFYLTSFIDRPERQRLTDIVEKSRMITVTGPGGGGKTRLVIEVLKNLKEKYSITFIDLSNANNYENLISIIVRALDIKDNDNLDPLKNIEETIEDNNKMIVFDNCENLIPELNQFIQPMMHHCSNLKILSISRQRLEIHGEVVFNIGFLKFPDNPNSSISDIMNSESVKLFVNRAQTLDPNIVFDDQEIVAIGKICAKLDGLPLAIILAASRIKLFNVFELLKKLDHRFTFLADIKDVYKEKHRTLRQTIAWSYNLLSDEEKTIIGIINSLPPSLSLDSICFVLDAFIKDVDCYKILQDLEDKSQIIVLKKNNQKRIKIPETIKEYIASDKHQSMNIPKAMGLFCQWIFEWLTTKHCECNGKADKCIEVLDAEIENANIVMDYLEKVNNDLLLFQINELLYQYWIFKGVLNDGLKRLHYLKNSSLIGDTSKFDICIMISNILIMKGNFLDAEKNMLSINRELLDAVQYKSYLSSLGNLYYSQGNYKKAKVYLRDYIDTIDKNDEKELYKTYKTLAIISSMDCDYPKAIMFLQSIIDECKNLSLNQKAYVYGNIGYFYGEVDDYCNSRIYHHKAYDLFLNLSNNTGIVSSLFNLGNIEMLLGNLEEAEKYSLKCKDIADEIGDRDISLSAFQNLAILDLKKGNIDKAERKLLKCLDMNISVGNVRREALTYKYLGDIHLQRQNQEEAISFYLSGARLFIENGSVNDALFVFSGMLDTSTNVGTAIKYIFAKKMDQMQANNKKMLQSISAVSSETVREKIDAVDPIFQKYLFELSDFIDNTNDRDRQ